MGKPLPGVEVRIVKPETEDSDETEILAYGNCESSKILTSASNEVSGELQVKGDSVFKMYWQKPEVTEKSFTKDGWFKTGTL